MSTPRFLFTFVPRIFVGGWKMLSNPMLGVAIGLIFLYLLLSSIVTVLQEFIASTLKLTKKNLQEALVVTGKKELTQTGPLPVAGT